ncbi:hypothetical protein GCM10009798_32710 [Nocardioides panacihumi]|uniref:Uncharacterized protein n=1 Tax=Nocardioides panacihumi TaxID=400774 RepID=A0ABN2RIW5_9ACTN
MPSHAGGTVPTAGRAVADAVAAADDGGRVVGGVDPLVVGVAVTVVVTVTVGVLGPAVVGSEEQPATSASTASATHSETPRAALSSLTPPTVD